MRSVFHARRIAVHQWLADPPRECRRGEQRITLQRAHDAGADRAPVVRRFIHLLIALLWCSRRTGGDTTVEPRRARREIAQLAQLGCRQNLRKMEHRLSVDAAIYMTSAAATRRPSTTRILKVRHAA